MDEDGKEWMKYLIRPTFTPLFIDSFINAYETNVADTIGAGLTKHLFIPSKKGMEWYISRNEFMNLGKAILEMVRHKKDFAKGHAEECHRTCEELVKVCKNIKKMNLKVKSSKELYLLFLKYNIRFREFVVYLAIPPPLDKFLTEKIEKKIQEILKKRGKPELFKKYFDALTTLTRLTDGIKEELELLEIAIEIEKNNGKINNQIDKLIEEHTRKYCWMSVYSFHLNPLQKAFFTKKIKDIKEPRRLISKKKQEFSENKRRFKEVLEDLKVSEELLNVINTLQEYIFLRTYRTDMLRKAFYHIQPLMEEIGRRIGLSREQTSYITLKEMKNVLTKNISLDRKKIEERAKHFLILKKPDIYTIVSNKKEINQIIEQELKIEEIKAQVIKGQGIYPGIVKGKVRIIWDIEDAVKVKKGDILVTSMTTPDMHSIIAKAGGIVTDEGGVTSHAAIISRELQIPCVIGTEIATKVLKDGVLVEVNSKDGIIREIDSNEERKD